MRNDDVTIVVDNSVTMGVSSNNVTRFVLAKGVVDELIERYRRRRSHVTVTLLRVVCIDRRCVFLQSTIFQRQSVGSRDSDTNIRLERVAHVVFHRRCKL